MGQQNDIGSMDPQTNTDSSTHMHLLYNALATISRDSKTGKWATQPALAESWDVQGQTVTIKLRKGVKFHDGTDFTAEVAKYNLERMQTHPRSTAKESVAPIASVDASDASTVKLTLKYPSSILIPSLSQAGENRPYIVSKAAAEKWGDEYRRHPAGTGAMELVDWRPGDQAVFKKSNNYWEMGADGKPLPYFDGATFRLIVDDSVRFMELRAGNLDAMDLVAAKDMSAAKITPNLVVDEKPWQGNLYKIVFNMMPGKQTAFFKSKGLRQAVGYAIDRDSLAKTLGMGAGRPWPYWVAEGNVGYDTAVPAYKYDPAKAKQLLAEAGYANGLESTLTVHSRALDQQHAQMLQQMFQAVGIRITIDVLERIAWNNKNKAGETQFSTLRGQLLYDPQLYMGKQLVSGAPSNWSNWENSQFDQCADEARSSFDEKQRSDTLKRCQNIVFDEAPMHFTWLQVWVDGTSSKLKGWTPGWDGFFDFTAAWLDN